MHRVPGLVPSPVHQSHLDFDPDRYCGGRSLKALKARRSRDDSVMSFTILFVRGACTVVRFRSRIQPVLGSSGPDLMACFAHVLLFSRSNIAMCPTAQFTIHPFRAPNSSLPHSLSELTMASFVPP